jgi:hypothetical protein
MSPISPSDIAYRMLRLEQQLEAYERLHAEELAEMRRALAELKDQVLTLAAQSVSSQNQQSSVME